MAKIAKQQLLIEYLVSSADTFALCNSLIKAEFFDPEYRKTLDFVKQYYEEYNTTPNLVQIEAETGLELEHRVVTRDEIEYCSKEVETFCKRRALERAILASPPLIDTGDYGKVENIIKDAINMSLNKDLGLDYFYDPRSRLEALAATPQRTSTKWKLFDDAIGGGLARKEMLLFSANSGGGKSVALANLAINFSAQGLTVMYISLELSEEMIGQRLDMMLTGIPTVAWKENMDEIVQSLNTIAPKMGGIYVKRMESGTTAAMIRGYIKEFELKHNMVPDLLIVDYLDIMGSNEKVSADNISEKDKRSAEQLRDILFDYNMFGATASQQNRSAIEAAELNQSHIAGGLTKVNTVDIYCSVILTPSMKAAGEVGITFLKTRSSDGVGRTIYLKWDNNSLRMLNHDNDKVDEDIAIINKVSKNKQKRSLTDMLEI